MKYNMIGKRLLSLLLTAVMLLSLVVLPSAPVASAESGSSSDLLEIDKKMPEGFKTTKNPYGYDVGVAFPLSTGHELLYMEIGRAHV